MAKLVGRMVSVLVLLFIGIPFNADPLVGSSVQAASGFLTLPFPQDPAMHIQQGWTSSFNPQHFGIDYIKGTINESTSWKTFPVLAAAAGEAEWVDHSVNGKYVFITHNINGVRYYTYYGHMASVASGIPLRGQGPKKQVVQGERIGDAGDTGPAANGVLHLHFALKNASDQSIDPYDLRAQAGHYPQPNAVSGSCGSNSYWISCPPSYSGSVCPNPIPGPSQVVLFENPNYGGRCVVKNYGKYPNASAIGLPNDSISSLRLGDGAVVLIYRDVEYKLSAGGNVFYGPINVPTLSSATDNQTSSAVVSHNAVVIMARRAGSSTALPNACWQLARNGDWSDPRWFQCDAYRGAADGITPFGAAARGLLGLVPGTWTLREVIPPSGYAKAPERTFTVAEGQTVRITIDHNPAAARVASSQTVCAHDARHDRKQDRDHRKHRAKSKPHRIKGKGPKVVNCSKEQNPSTQIGQSPDTGDLDGDDGASGKKRATERDRHHQRKHHRDRNGGDNRGYTAKKGDGAIGAHDAQNGRHWDRRKN